MSDIINWPIAVIILGGIAIFTFRPALIRLIDRLKSASKEGFQFDRGQDYSRSHASLHFIEIMSQPLSPSAAIREKKINEQLHESQIQEPIQQAKALSRALAIASVDLEFMMISSSIFGSQLMLLNHLSALPQGINIHEATEMFHIAQSQYPDIHTHRTHEEWLSYITTMQLVVVSESNVITLTQYGRDFMKYLIDESLTSPRYG